MTFFLSLSPARWNNYVSLGENLRHGSTRKLQRQLT